MTPFDYVNAPFCISFKVKELADETDIAANDHNNDNKVTV